MKTILTSATSKVWARVKQAFKRKQVASNIIFVPTYDDGTRAMARWITKWGLKNIHHCVGQDAEHHRAITLIEEASAERRLIIFAGHGKAAGLLTKPNLGKVGSPISNSSHGCLLDTEDIKPSWKHLHVVAWACHSAAYFGPGIAAINGSAFLGFRGPVNIVINHQASEDNIWSPAMKALCLRIMDKNAVESHDAEWLRESLLALRRQLKSGTINTGIHNRINSMFLKAAAKNATVHVAKG